MTEEGSDILSSGLIICFNLIRKFFRKDIKSLASKATKIKVFFHYKHQIPKKLSPKTKTLKNTNYENLPNTLQQYHQTPVC